RADASAPLRRALGRRSPRASQARRLAVRGLDPGNPRSARRRDRGSAGGPAPRGDRPRSRRAAGGAARAPPAEERNVRDVRELRAADPGRTPASRAARDALRRVSGAGGAEPYADPVVVSDQSPRAAGLSPRRARRHAVMIAVIVVR